MTKELLFDKYKEHGKLTDSGIIYLPIKFGVMFIKECSKYDLAVIGLDFYTQIYNEIKPVVPCNGLDCSIYLNKYSIWNNIVNACNKVSIQTLEMVENEKHSIFFEPTILEKSEWERAN